MRISDWSSDVCSSDLQAGLGGVARRGHRFERAALVLEVALGGLDQVRDQVEAPLQLHVDLGEGVLVRVARGDQAVVDADRPEREHDHNCEQDQHGNHQSSPCSCNSGIRRYDRPAIAAYAGGKPRSEEHTSELQSLMRISYAVFCLKKKKKSKNKQTK